MSEQTNQAGMAQYEAKSARYYQNAREDVRGLFDPRGKRILDIACGGGAIGAALKARGAAEVVGVEYVPDAAAQAREVLDAVITGDVNEVAFPYASGYFDLILCLDILEHLPYPEDSLARLVPLLSEAGRMIVSVPNVRYIGTIKKLIFEADWPRQASGVFDGTHLRWFTHKSAARLFQGQGLRIVRRQRNPLKPFSLLRHPAAWMDTFLPDWFTTQFVYVLEKTK